MWVPRRSLNFRPACLEPRPTRRGLRVISTFSDLELRTSICSEGSLQTREGQKLQNELSIVLRINRMPLREALRKEIETLEVHTALAGGPQEGSRSRAKLLYGSDARYEADARSDPHRFGVVSVARVLHET